MSEYVEADLIDPTNQDEVKVCYPDQLIPDWLTRFIQGVVYLEVKNMKETNMDSLRIRLIAAVQESDQDQDSESLARRATREVRTGKKKVDIQLGELKDPMRFGKSVNGDRGIKCNLCEAVLSLGSTFKKHLGNSSYYKLSRCPVI